MSLAIIEGAKQRALEQATTQPVEVKPWEALATPVSAEWFSVPPPRRRYLLRDLHTGKGALPLGISAQLVAEGGAGKTMALVQLAASVATGEPWLGAFSVETPGRVLLILGEEDAGEARRRVYNAVRSSKAPAKPEDGSIVVLPLAGVPCEMIRRGSDNNLQNGEFLTWLLEWVQQNGPFALVIIDPLSRFGGSDAETDNAAGTRFVQAAESIANATGASVIVAHHSNKLSRGGGKVETSSARGVTSLTDGARYVMTMAAERFDFDSAEERAHLGEIVTLSVTKSNYTRKPAPVLLRRDLDNGGALVPLDDTDRDLLKEARAVNDKGAHKARRTLERTLASQAKQEESRQKAEAKAQAKQVRTLAEEQALVSVLRAKPGIGTRDLRAAMQVALDGCSQDAIDATLARLGPAVGRKRGARNSVEHTLVEEHLSAHLRGSS